jgi:filamentous hemagglutinin
MLRWQCWVEFSPNGPEWLANYVSPQDAKDLGLSELDQFRCDAEQFGQDLKNQPRDVANTRVGIPGDVQQGDASPQADKQAAVTTGRRRRSSRHQYGLVSVWPGVVTPGAPILSSGRDSDDSLKL